jgi:IS5 family transposase
MRGKPRQPPARIQIRLAEDTRLRRAHRRGGVDQTEGRQDEKEGEFGHGWTHKIKRPSRRTSSHRFQGLRLHKTTHAQSECLAEKWRQEIENPFFGPHLLSAACSLD